MNIKQLIQQSIHKLTDSPTARLDAELLLTMVLDRRRSYLYSHPEQVLSNEQYEHFSQLLKQRQHGKPIAYLTGKQAFWSLTLAVNHAVLIPRPETELLVEKALSLFDRKACIRVLELGTGSGAIALALAHERPHWQIMASDHAKSALAQAQHNATQLSIGNIRFIHSDWYQQLSKQVFDIIISNPPYLAENDPHLSRGDLRFEPISALASGEDGLTAIHQIIAQAPPFLAADGYLLLEHGYQQSDAVAQQLTAHHFHHIRHYKDLAGQPRMSIGQRSSQASNSTVACATAF